MPVYRVITPCGGSDVTITFPSTSGTLALSGAGLTGFIPSQNTAAPNNTVNASRLLVDAASTNADIVLQPKGTGAFLAQLPDSTATGGNKRGVNAVDLQTTRSAATSVASGAYSVIAGGQNNAATGNYAAVLSGTTNTVSSAFSSIVGGQNNSISQQYSAIGGGFNNSVLGSYSNVNGGQQNQNQGNWCAIGGGQNNFIESGKSWGTIIGGNGARVRDNGVACFANNYFVFTGDAQFTDTVYTGRTTVGTAQYIGLAGSTGAGSGISVPPATAVGFEIMLVCRQTASSNVGAWRINGLVENTGGTLTAYNVTVNLIHRSVAAWTTNVIANSTADTIDLEVNGSAGVTVQWVASCRFTFSQIA